jgi:signal transduction histidine kinase/CheY-like chemotaxis protein
LITVPLLSLWPAFGLVAVAGTLASGMQAWRLGRERTRLFVHTQRLEDHTRSLGAEVRELREAADARDRAEALSEAKSRFIATLSHEIRTPLNGIIGTADLLAATPLSREQQAYVTMIKTSGTALTTLIDEILDFSRIESGRLELAAEPFDLSVLVEGVVELMAPRAQEKGLDIAASIAPSVPRRLVGDPLRLRQVLTNLTDNAVKFTERGGVGVSVTSTPDGAIRFSVTDTGPGVPADRRAAIFEEFEQAHESTTRTHGGAGLGLAIVRRIITRMGGDLNLRDSETGGSVFSFSVVLPADDTSPDRRPDCPTLEGQRALIVSAAAFLPLFLGQQLQSRGARVAVVPDTAHALRSIAERGSVDLLLVDASLGDGAAQQLAAAAKAAGIDRTVLLFSPAERRTFGQARNADYQSWLVKPVRSLSLDRLLRGSYAPPSDQLIHQQRGYRRNASAARPRVLVAEDNPINALLARAALERFGASVLQAEDGIAALSCFEAAVSGDAPPFDLVLMDVSMPGLDGLDVTRRIREAERSSGLPPAHIVAMTAHTFEATLAACRDAGMDDVMTKPIHPDAFRDLVRGAPRQANAAR